MQYQESKFVAAPRQREIALHVSEYTAGQNLAKTA